MKNLLQSEPDQFRWYQLVLPTLVVAFGVLMYCRWAQQRIETREIRHRVYATLESLEAKRPPSMTPLQWKVAVEWTSCLVANCMPVSEDDLRDFRRFQAEFEKKAGGDVDLRTLLWVWDQFDGLTPAGRKYQRFRQRMLVEIDNAGKVPATVKD